MCGIAGIFYADQARPVDRTILHQMGMSLAHRGPDAEGIYEEPGLGMVHRRLSIIDLQTGDQPIANEDGSLQVVFNGEIYNYEELCRELKGRGHSFRTQSDTETIVHLYEEQGEQLVQRLRGMFAFALWDRKKRELLLARDRLGIKPLYVYRDSEKLLFASELKAILVYPGIDRSISPEAIEDYLAYGVIPGARSIFTHIEKLPPAHTCRVNAENLQQPPRRYWQLQFVPDYEKSEEEWQEVIREKVQETVAKHLIADVPVGAFLSGGIDSSVLVACCAEETVGRLQTFSMGFKEESFSELPFAQQVANQYGTTHTEEVVTPDALELLNQLTYHYDEPFADSSAIPTFLVSRLASTSVKVVLSGDGGDEAFGGYSRYAHDQRESLIRRRLPGWFQHCVLRPLAGIWPKADWLPRTLRAKTLLTNLSLDESAAYANTLSICRQPLRRKLLAPDISQSLNGYSPAGIVEKNYQSSGVDDALSGMLAADSNMILPDDFLVKVDRASMAHGLEVRPPFLDHELMELAARIPSHLKIRRGRTKWILKETYREKLPEGLMERPKQGFEIPVDSWLRGPLRQTFEETVLDGHSRIRDFINPQVVNQLYKAHNAKIGRHGNVLWTLLMLARWADRYLTRGDGA